MAISVIEVGTQLDLIILINDSSGLPATGKTVELFIQRQSDDQYWTGAVWGSLTWLSATGIGNGMYKYDFTFPSDEDKYTIYWRELSLPIYALEDVQTFSTPDVVWDEQLSAHPTAGSAGATLNALGINLFWSPTEQGIATLPVPGQAFISTTGGISDSDDAVELDRIDNFPDAGYVQFVSGEVAYYDGITGRTLQNLERGAFGTTPAAQAEDSQVLYVIPRPLIISLINGANQPVAPDSAPKVQIIDNHGDDILAEEDMTLVSTGVYQSWVMLNPLMEPDVWRVKFTTVVGGNTAIIWQNLTINKPTASVNLNMFEGDFQVDQDGYRDSSGTFTEWGDAQQGPVTQLGSPIGGLQVTAFNVVNNARIYSNNPPGVSFTNQLGKWDMKLYAGTYDFLFTKKNFTTVTVRRTIA